eukprot:450103-Prorocentrum_minimum.AAC.1
MVAERSQSICHDCVKFVGAAVWLHARHPRNRLSLGELNALPALIPEEHGGSHPGRSRMAGSRGAGSRGAHHIHHHESHEQVWVVAGVFRGCNKSPPAAEDPKKKPVTCVGEYTIQSKGTSCHVVLHTP